jgi:hypothetical protein
MSILKKIIGPEVKEEELVKKILLKNKVPNLIQKVIRLINHARARMKR